MNSDEHIIFSACAPDDGHIQGKIMGIRIESTGDVAPER